LVNSRAFTNFLQFSDDVSDEDDDDDDDQDEWKPRLRDGMGRGTD